jgi:hypothetical protein
MRKALAALAVLALVITPLQATAAAKAGAACTKAGAISTVAGIKYTCVKSGKKLVWDKGVKLIAAAKPIPAPTVTPTPAASPTPAATPIQSATPTPTPAKTFNSLWEKYNLTKPVSADDVIKKATDNFKSYTSVIRKPDQVVRFYAQPGVDQTLITWVRDGSTFVAQRFEYPKLPPTFSSIIAIDKTWLEATYISAGFSAREAKSRSDHFCGGAPACGGADSNLWNYSVMQKNNSIVNDPSGSAQTPGHELFHAIHGILVKDTKTDAAGTNVPNWYIEGPAMFVGLQTAGVLGFSDYLTVGRPSMTKRFKNGRGTNLTATLSEFKANDGVVDPYAIGFAAVEFLVAQVGVEKMVNVYVALGEGKNFDNAFKQGTGIELADFYSMFEEIRATLGFAKG